MSVYLDSCIVIYYVERHPVFFPMIRDRLIPPSSVQDPVVILSHLTRMECRIQPKRSSDDELLARFDEFFALPDFRWASMDRQVFDLATDLRARFSLKTPDALHLAAAIHYGCTEFWTNDLRLKPAAVDRLHIVNPLDSAKE